jgi:cell division protein FtsQ
VNGKKPRILDAIVLVTITLALVLGANAWKSSLKVKQIKVDGNRIVGTNEILQLTQIPLDNLLYQTDLTTIQRNVMSHHYIKDVIVERNLPNTIHITVIERIPIAIVDRTEIHYLDESGFVLPRTVSKKLLDIPIISGIPPTESLTLGSTVSQQDVKEALLLLTTLKIVNRPMYHNISEVQVRNGGDIVFYSIEGSVPIIFGRGELSSKIVKLETFWNEIVRTRGPQHLMYLDLRYQDQIVARWNSAPATTKNL